MRSNFDGVKMSKWAKGWPHSSDIECDSLVQLPRLWDDEGVWNRVVARIRPENCLGHDFWNAKYKWSTMHNDVADEPGWRTVDCVDQFAPPPLLLQLLQLCERIVNRLTQLREILSSTNGPRRSSLKYKHKMKFGSNSCLTRVGLVSSWRPRHINVGYLWEMLVTFENGERSGRSLSISLFFSSALSLGFSNENSQPGFLNQNSHPGFLISKSEVRWSYFEDWFVEAPKEILVVHHPSQLGGTGSVTWRPTGHPPLLLHPSERPTNQWDAFSVASIWEGRQWTPVHRPHFAGETPLHA